MQAYAGRYTNQWGPYGEASTILSPNARSFDHFNITLGNSRFNVSGILGELDNLDRNGNFGRGNTIGGIRRFLALHRIDIKVTDRLRLNFFDGFIYSSQSTFPSLKYLIPTNFLFFDRNVNPVNDDFNALFGGQIWLQISPVTFNLQLMIDDIVIQDGKLRSEIEPTTFAITHSVHYAGVTNFLDIGYETEFISYQTYNTSDAEGRYLFLQRGIANQFTDYILGKLYADIHAHQWISGMTLTPSFQYLLQGEQEINQPYRRFYDNGELVDIILTGNEEKRSRVNLDVLYNPFPEFWLNVSLGYNVTKNADHVISTTHSRITARFEAGFRLSLDTFSEQ